MTTSTSWPALAEVVGDVFAVAVERDRRRRRRGRRAWPGARRCAPAAMTRLAPKCLATCTASGRRCRWRRARARSARPRTSMRRRSATQDDMAGFIAAATAIGSLSVGQHDAAAEVDHGLLGHRAHRGVGQDEVAQPPVRGRGPRRRCRARAAARRCSCSASRRPAIELGGAARPRARRRRTSSASCGLGVGSSSVAWAAVEGGDDGSVHGDSRAPDSW